MASDTQITQNNKITTFFLQYLNKEVSDFLHPDKHESFPQIDIMILMGMIKHFVSTRSKKFALSLLYPKKK